MRSGAPGSVLRTVIRISVPSGTLTSGPGICGALPSSANVWTMRTGSLGPCPSGCHRATTATRCSVRTPSFSTPAGVRLSLATAVATGGAGGAAEACLRSRAAPTGTSEMTAKTTTREGRCRRLILLSADGRSRRGDFKCGPLLPAMTCRAAHRRVGAVQGLDLLQVLVVDGDHH